MKLFRSAIVALLALGLGSVAWAIQPGTSGTEKRFQDQGLRSGVLLQKNNTATASAGAATLNEAGSGVVTTEALTTGMGSDYTLTLTNNMIGAGDVVMAAVDLGSATLGVPAVMTVTPSANTAVIVVRNMTGNNAAPLNGTLRIRFWVLKQNANGSD